MYPVAGGLKRLKISAGPFHWGPDFFAGGLDVFSFIKPPITNNVNSRIVYDNIFYLTCVCPYLVDL